MKKLLIFLLLFVVLAVGYFLGNQRSTAPVDTINASVSAAPLSQTKTSAPKVTSTPKTTAKPTATPTNESKAQEYVLNKNTNKFHYPSCSSVKQMKEKNKIVKFATREEIINLGYEPCGRCHP